MWKDIHTLKMASSKTQSIGDAANTRQNGVNVERLPDLSRESSNMK